jgi:tetratricopeptide (TPR) repeat protein/tRNA A-37 threonylcarbamoyl transferase component Bud32
LRGSLQQALGDVFLLERELRGGMSRVFIARETALGRRVVLKVLPPDLAASLSTERFRREIQVAASLQHPHIVPLLSAGRAGDFIYYTMPYVEGESLRERLAQGGELPVRTAVRILGEVARALAYAHRHGIVHRDIKPDNILLTGDDAQVADFGIAKAIAASAEYGELTSVGVALGTPHYMAPEQALADPTTDARADLYSLGVVAYEMLAGQPPFQGRSAAQLLAAHATERPVPLRDRRRAVPVALGDMIMQLLEKRPADRPQSADELLSILEVSQAAADPAPTTRVSAPYASTAPYPLSAPSARSASSAFLRGRWLVAGAVATLALILVIASLRNRQPAVRVDRSVVAVAPFRVSGADSSLGYLREGMVDLLAAKLSGTSGIRAADPRALLAAWRKVAGPSGDLPEAQAVSVAQRVGAGRLIQGDVVGTRQQVTINAAVLKTPGAAVLASASVEGSPDSLPRLVDRLAIKLLALQAGEGEQRLATLTTTSLPALRAYLEGQALIRRGAFKQAASQFQLAIQQDSTFALAGLGLSRAGEWFGQPADGPGSLLAWRYRDKLPPVDRVLLDVYLGPRWPAPRRWRDAITQSDRLVRMAPDNVEAWYELGDNLYHFGPLVGMSDAQTRAAEAFSRALALDSSFAPTLEHRSSLSLALGDTAEARKALALLLRTDSTSGFVASERWAFASAVGDSAGRAAAIHNDSLIGPYLLSIGLSLGLPLQDANIVLRKNRARAVTAEDQTWTQRFSHLTAVITGWPSLSIPLPLSIPELERLVTQYREWRFSGGDSAAGTTAGATLESAIGIPLPPDPLVAIARYTGGQYALERGRFDLAERALEDLRRVRVPPDSGYLGEVPNGFALLLQAQLESKRHSSNLPRVLVQLDSALINASFVPFTVEGNLIAARLYEEQGNLPQALAAIRRRVWDLNVTPLYVTYHREEGRLAALNGDREGAVRAYQRYLAIRSGAEPRLQPQVKQVRGELEALERESTDR